jgi:dienelactone hydrolase
MNGQNTKYWRLIIISVVLMVGGSLLASWLNTGAGAATVQDIKIMAANGYVISAYLYTPKGVSAQKTAPAVLMFHGLNNQKDYMSNTALEFARRGYIVLSADMTGHGFSNGVNAQNGYDGPDALKYLFSLPTVDKNNIGLIGMSQGGFGAVTAAADALPDDYSSIFYMESECTAPGNPDLTPCKGLKNVAFNIGGFTELGGMVMVDKGANAVTSPVLLPVFGTKDPIVPGKMYGSIADGTARILYQPYEEHAGSTDSPAAIGNAITWMGMTLKGGTGLPANNQIWPWKLLGTALALFGALLYLFPMGAILLRTHYFNTISETVPVYKGFKGIGWWIGALITTALGPLLYLWAWQNEFFNGLIPANSIWPQGFTNIYMLWSIVVGIIAIAFILIDHFVFTKKQGATADNYGLTWEGKKVDWIKIWKSLQLAVLILVPLYVLLAFINGVFYVDFRAWVVALMPMNGIRLQAFIWYLIPFAIYLIPQGIIFAGFLRVKNGQASIGREMVVNSIVLTLGALVWLILMYVPLMAGGTEIMAGGPLGPIAAGLGGIYYIPLLVLWPLVACLYTFFFRKTGRVYTGVFLAVLFIVWYLAAFGEFAVAP